jgi:RNA polymerase sigma-70 factor (ECF subfamily)
MTRLIKKKLLRRVCENMSDRQLIELTLADMPVAYDVLAERHRPRVEAVAAQFLRDADREDCVQETFLKGLTHLPELRERDKFASWLCVIARNVCLDTIRKSAPVSSIEQTYPWEPMARMQVASTSPSPLVEFIRNEEYRRLHDGIELLAEKYRLVLNMRYFDGSDYATISAKIRKPLGTVKSLIHRGRKRLRSILADEAIQGGGAVVN